MDVARISEWCSQVDLVGCGIGAQSTCSKHGIFHPCTDGQSVDIGVAYATGNVDDQFGWTSGLCVVQPNQ
jgi:hypothetical protein